MRHAWKACWPLVCVSGVFLLVDRANIAPAATLPQEKTATAARDQPPAVDFILEGGRKTKQGYLVTRKASIPCRASVHANSELTALAYVVTAERWLAPNKFGAADKEQRVPVETFARRPAIQSFAPDSVRRFEIRPDDGPAALDLSKLPRPIPRAEPDTPPAWYRLTVRLEATARAADAGMFTGRSEPCILIVVPEIDLLLEIAKEEEMLALTFDEKVEVRLRQPQRLFDKLKPQLVPKEPEEIVGLDAAAIESQKQLDRVLESIQEIRDDFRRILRELRLNQVRAEMLVQVEKTVVEPLNDLERQCAQFRKTLGGICESLEKGDSAKARKAGIKAGEQLDDLVVRRIKVTRALRDLQNRNEDLKLHRIIEDLIGDRE